VECNCRQWQKVSTEGIIRMVVETISSCDRGEMLCCSRRHTIEVREAKKINADSRW
jgi:hypothetical protein